MANITELATGFPGYNGRQPQDKAAIGSILHKYGYISFALGKWHNTASEETGPSGPYDRWPSGPVFGFDRFYGFFGGDSNQWYPKLHLDREPVDQPRLPEEGYHFSEDITDKAISFIGNQQSVDPDKSWLCYLAFAARQKKGSEPFGAGGIGRIFVDGKKVAEGEIARTTAFGYSLDETFDIGCDKGAPVTDEYRALASLTGKIVKVDVDLKPDFARDDVRHGKEQFNQAMLRQ